MWTWLEKWKENREIKAKELALFKRNDKWVYLGYTETNWTITYRDGRSERHEKAIMHFYAWGTDMKRREYKFVSWEGVLNPKWLERDVLFNKNIVPWLEGGDMWKPIVHPIAVTGNLIDFYKDPASHSPK